MKKPPLALVPPPGAPAELPGALLPEVQAWVDDVKGKYELEPHHEELLKLAAVQLNRAATAREIVDKKGLTFVDRFRQPKPRPEVAIERDAANAARMLLRELGLDLPGPDDNRPPRVGG